MATQSSFRKTALAGFLSVLSVSSASVLAQGTPALEEVLVTAQKVEEGFLDVPVAVSSISGETLDMAKATEFQELVQVSPSLTFNQSGDARGAGILIRGIGTTAFQTAVEPTVSTVVDGVTMGRTVQFLSDLADIERVEVLRGPQGTLFGKNASAGVINIITKRPSDVFEGSVKAGMTDDDAWSVGAQVSGPLTDSVRGRISAYKKEFDGFVHNAFNGETINGDESQGVRGKLEFDLTDRANLLLIGDYSTQDRDCCVTPLVDTNGNRFLEFDYRDIEINEKNDTVMNNLESFSNTETAGVSAELNMDFDNFMFTSITAYRGFELQSQQDVDDAPYSGPAYGRFLIPSNGTASRDDGQGSQEQSQFSQELRVTTTAWNDFDVTAGLFYWDQTVERRFEREVFLCTDPSPGDLSLSPDPEETACNEHLYGFGVMDSQVDTINWAAFGQANWRFAPDWKASLGWRYTEDDLEFEIARETPAPGPAVAPSFTGGNQTKEDNLSGKLSLQWDFANEAMWFGSYAEGYKSPAFDLIFSTDESRTDPVAPETSEAWETGIKSEMFDRRLRVSLTGFHTTFNDLQGQGTVPDQIGFVLTSAGSAVTQGLELDFTAKPTANLLLNGGVAYIDATFDDFPAAQCYSGQTEAEGCIGGIQELSGKDIPNSPDLKTTLQARYDIPLEGPVDLWATGTYRWQSESPGNQNQDPALERESYGLFDLTVGLDSKDGHWSAQLYAKNLFDQYYQDQRLRNVIHGGFNHFLTRDSSRYIGVEVEYRFGSL